MREWLELLRRLGDALLELATAEVDALADDLRRGGRQAARSVLWLSIAFVLACHAWALLTLALVWGLATWIGAWQAALAVGAAYVVGAIAFIAAARAAWRITEAPLDTVKRRWREQNAWFRDRLLTLPPGEQGRDDAG
jgi:hypothetical protein